MSLSSKAACYRSKPRHSSSGTGITKLFTETRPRDYPFHIVNVATRRLKKAVDPFSVMAQHVQAPAKGGMKR